MKRGLALKSMSLLTALTSSFQTCTLKSIPMALTASITMKTLWITQAEIQSLSPHSKRRTKWMRLRIGKRIRLALTIVPNRGSSVVIPCRLSCAPLIPPQVEQAPWGSPSAPKTNHSGDPKELGNLIIVEIPRKTSSLSRCITRTLPCQKSSW